MLIVPSCTYSVAAYNFWLFPADMETDLYWCLIVKCICFQHTSFPWFTANQFVSWWWWKHSSKPFQLVSAFKSWVRRIFFLLALGLSKSIGDCWYYWIKVATCQKWCAKKKWLWGVCSQSPSQLEKLSLNQRVGHIFLTLKALFHLYAFFFFVMLFQIRTVFQIVLKLKKVGDMEISRQTEHFRYPFEFA